MERIQAAMHKNLKTAIAAFRKLSREKMQAAAIEIEEIISLKYQMERIADQRGYSLACKTSIPTCRGKCCKWHFPRNLTPVDFFIAIFRMSEEQQAVFSELIFNSNKNYCPILLETGCFLSFEERPVICTNAYPCFNDRSYWQEKEKKNIRFKRAFDTLDVAVQFKGA